VSGVWGQGCFAPKHEGGTGAHTSPELSRVFTWLSFSHPQVMVTNVTSLLKTVKAVEDEATKGTRALEATIEHIRQELAVSTAVVLQLPSLLPAAPCLTTASLLAGLLLPCASRQGLHPRGLHPYDERHHDGHSQSGGRWQLVPAGGRHRHGQPEPTCHRGYAARLQGGEGSRPGSSKAFWGAVGAVSDGAGCELGLPCLRLSGSRVPPRSGGGRASAGTALRQGVR